jgi:hypothetical protein
VLYSQQDKSRRDDATAPEYIDIRPEKTALQAFLNSPTAVAYYVFVAEKSRQASEAGRKEEVWRTFFLRLGQLLNTANQYEAAQQAAQLEKMFDTITDKDIEEMSDSLEDLVSSIKSMMKARPYDPIFNVLVDRPGEQPFDFPKFVKYLREHGVQDPDVDLASSVISGDVNLTKDAFSRGAKVSVTGSDIIARYPEQVKRYRESMQAEH